METRGKKSGTFDNTLFRIFSSISWIYDKLVLKKGVFIVQKKLLSFELQACYMCILPARQFRLALEQAEKVAFDGV